MNRPDPLSGIFEQVRPAIATQTTA